MNRSLIYLCLAASAAQAAPAIPDRSAERVEIFATCSGRLAALATRQRAYGESGAEENERLRDMFEHRVEATLPFALGEGVSERQPDRWRIGGWTEMATMLADMEHGKDERRVNRARIDLQTRIGACRSLLLVMGFCSYIFVTRALDHRCS